MKVEVARKDCTKQHVLLSGYANEVGEAFRSLVHRSIVHSSYVVAFGYVFADAVSKALKPVS